jgi:uncharacterized protein (DUF1697 family)
MASGKYVALLRGINVGRANRITMDRLRQLFTDMGYTDISTLLQSGNVLFSPPRGAKPDAVAAAIEKRIEADLSMKVGVVVRTAAEMAAVVAGNPMPEHLDEPAKFVVAFLSAAPRAAAVEAIDRSAYAPEVFEVSGREVYAYCASGLNATKFGNVFWEKQLGVVATVRNWRTVQALADRVAQP